MLVFGGRVVAQIDRDYVSHGYARVARRISSYGLFEGRPATTKGQWFNPLVFGWLRTLANLPGQPGVEKPVFITGLGRSGTTILGVLLSLHREVGFLNEPKAMWHVIDPRQDVNGNYGGVGVRYRMEASDVTPEVALTAHRVFGRYLACVGAHRLVDKYPELIFRVPYLRAIFPDARVVFIYRSGVDACQSIVKWSQRLGRESNEGTEDWWGRNDSKWRNLWAELVAADSRYEEVANIDPMTIDHANRAALEWIVTMREGMAREAAAPGSLIRIRYEDLLARPEEELSRLLSACDLPRDDAVFEYAKKRLYDNPAKSMPQLLPPVRRWFDETMADLGY
jgi:hypothetical protein